MMVKRGINTNIERKQGPVVKNGTCRPVKKVVTCRKCGAKLEKSCPSELACELSRGECPRCGAEI